MLLAVGWYRFVQNDNVMGGGLAQLVLDQRSYSTLGPVSAWMGDRLRQVNYLGM